MAQEADRIRQRLEFTRDPCWSNGFDQLLYGKAIRRLIAVDVPWLLTALQDTQAELSAVRRELARYHEMAGDYGLAADEAEHEARILRAGMTALTGTVGK